MSAKILAMKVDAALDTFEAAVEALLAECHAEHARYMLKHSKPHPIHERAGDFIRAAVASRPQLALMLGLTPEPRRNVADAFPK